jgi:hypothetical protein
MLSDWDRWYPECEPVGHLLRQSFKRRWVRFHSLPGSKRYPEDDAEYVEVLRRHNAILGELARPGEAVVLLTTDYSDSKEPEATRSYPELAALDPNAKLWRTLDGEASGAGIGYWHCSTSDHVWEPGTFDPIVRLVAEDVVANVLMVAADCSWVLHPYDGGMDVIAESEAFKEGLRGKYKGWLSARPDGL